MKKVTINVNPVTFCGDKVTKYQAFASCAVSDDRTIRIIGDPEPTEDKAYESLKREYNTWSEAIGCIGKELIS